ncbi:MAG: hypothetical protein JOZ49_10160 [Mycolicibacterium sp.]|nr:hypothetical protein [Mycolicibacterium sp.]
MGEPLAQNARSGVDNVPVSQRLTDEVVYPSINDKFVDQQCAAGQALNYWQAPITTESSHPTAHRATHRLDAGRHARCRDVVG